MKAEIKIEVEIETKNEKISNGYFKTIIYIDHIKGSKKAPYAVVFGHGSTEEKAIENAFYNAEVEHGLKVTEARPSEKTEK